MEVVNRLRRNGTDSMESFKLAWTQGGLQQSRFPDIGPATIRQLRIWLRSPLARKAFKECSTPIVVNLSPEALDALSSLEDSMHEDRSEIINQLIVAANALREP
ncbi:hypothetical protein [Billgrantia montanilacus]|uniref:Uncharacterized protein n=1 Tax=Billgrantia montanilacus TaxID=2282305 RepID=A0A368TQP1_9GAMM|nr:hypothetical protein [Halomonas montanilacus]RCV86931.1 hypothetical protein DU505_19075 [Halomonas montanilacus]